MFKPITRMLLAVSCSALTVTVFAQDDLYRWKDQTGKTYISESPPPSSCSSEDCLTFRRKLAEKLEKKREQQQANEKKIREEWAAQQRDLEESKARVKACKYRTEKCSISLLKLDLGSIASAEGENGILKILGKPDHIQNTGHLIESTYWYYKLGNNTVQLVWEKHIDRNGLSSINFY